MALAITSLPVPVSPWIRTAESTGATRSTSDSNARNFGLVPIKSKVVIAFLLLRLDKGLFLFLILALMRHDVAPRSSPIQPLDSCGLRLPIWGVTTYPCCGRYRSAA